ncbi:uncharacterized protein AAGF69_004526 isoform 1-T1 [Amazona ochrocephala]
MAPRPAHGCGSGALLGRFGVLLQALLALCAFSTLMQPERFHVNPRRDNGQVPMQGEHGKVNKSTWASCCICVLTPYHGGLPPAIKKLAISALDFYPVERVCLFLIRNQLEEF